MSQFITEFVQGGIEKLLGDLRRTAGDPTDCTVMATKLRDIADVIEHCGRACTPGSDVNRMRAALQCAQSLVCRELCLVDLPAGEIINHCTECREISAMLGQEVSHG